jgi:hypothetical protein
MRLKTELYPEQQKQIREELMDLLNLKETNCLILYELDQDKELQEKIMDFLPRIHNYFSMSTITAISYPDKIKRPYVSIIRHLLKNEYQILSTEYTIKAKPKNIRTKRYYFVQRQDIKN